MESFKEKIIINSFERHFCKRRTIIYNQIFPFNDKINNFVLIDINHSNILTKLNLPEILDPSDGFVLKQLHRKLKSLLGLTYKEKIRSSFLTSKDSKNELLESFKKFVNKNAPNVIWELTNYNFVIKRLTNNSISLMFNPSDLASYDAFHFNRYFDFNIRAPLNKERLIKLLSSEEILNLDQMNVLDILG